MSDNVSSALAQGLSKAKDKNQDNASKGENSVVMVSNEGVVNIGDDNIGDININVTKQSETAFAAGPQHITPATALQIKKIVSSLVEKEVADGAEPRKAYTRWWKYLNSTYNVSTYREIPRDMGEDAIKWLNQQAPKLSPAEKTEANEKEASHDGASNFQETAVLRAPREEKISGHSQQDTPSDSSIWSMIRKWFR